MQTSAHLIVKCLEAQGVELIFGIPGAKIDAVFDALNESSIRLIVCRHEQNATFMAAAYGRLTGKPGVVLVTSGPGVANMATGLLTATTEGDPVIAIGGNVARSFQLRESHQKADNAKLMEAVTKWSVEATSSQSIPEIIANAFRNATSLRKGACFISLPQDILFEETNVKPVNISESPSYGHADSHKIKDAAELINKAKLPVILLGEEASREENTQAIRNLLKDKPFPVVGTFQAAGVIPRDLEHLFVGRVGLFRNQPGDVLLQKADLVVTIGFNPVEYDPEQWNSDGSAKIIHIDYQKADIHLMYQPKIELVGDITKTIQYIGNLISSKKDALDIAEVKRLHNALYEQIAKGKDLSGDKIHPLRFIYELRTNIDDDTQVICDIGTVYMWMARYFLCYQPHHLLFSNGQQTLGVALPWAIAASLTNPGKKIISVSGDGGFLFSAMELETAVREKANFVHFVWTDGQYNMVYEQEIMKYKRKSGVDFGHIDIVSFAKAFGAKGYELNNPDDFKEILQEAMAHKGPVLINVPIDYSDNPELFSDSNPYSGN